MIDARETERLLRKWGRWFGPPPPAEWDEEDTGFGQVNVLQAAIERLRVAPAPILEEPVLGERVVRKRTRNGAWEPTMVAQRYTAKGRPSRPVVGERVWHPDPEAARVERLHAKLYRANRLRGVVLRIEYCSRDRLVDKCANVGRAMDMPGFRRRRFHYELGQARAWFAEHWMPPTE